jgi:hypothetical protein
MRSCSPHHADVFSHLPARVMAELDTPATAALLGALVLEGWSAEQLRHQVGAYLTDARSSPSAVEAAERVVSRLAVLRSPTAGSGQAPDETAASTCALCAAESAVPVTESVHLCRRCVALLATGRARLADTG